MSIHYENWSKAGHTPVSKVDNPIEHIKYFNWLPNWIDIYFFNKVSDYILGLIFVMIVLTITFFKKSRKVLRTNKDNYLIIVMFFIFLIEWFYNHPALRYGGYSLIAIIFFLPTSILLSKIDATYKNIFNRTLLMILIVTTVFLFRNINRINNEIEKYKYQPILKTYYRLNEEHFRIQNKFDKLIINFNNCKENNDNCSKELNNKIKKVFNNSYMFLDK